VGEITCQLRRVGNVVHACAETLSFRAILLGVGKTPTVDLLSYSSVIFELCFLRDGSLALTVLMPHLHFASLFREKMLICFDLALISPFMFQFLRCYNAHQRILHHTLGIRRKRVIFEYSW
jgi:hypothetical protein